MAGFRTSRRTSARASPGPAANPSRTRSFVSRSVPRLVRVKTSVCPVSAYSSWRRAASFSPGRSQSQNTLILLAEQGFDYVTDWANDDMPYMVTTPSGSLCAMPLTYERSDRHLLVHHNLTVDAYAEQASIPRRSAVE